MRNVATQKYLNNFDSKKGIDCSASLKSKLTEFEGWCEPYDWQPFDDEKDVEQLKAVTISFGVIGGLFFMCTWYAWCKYDYRKDEHGDRASSDWD